MLIKHILLYRKQGYIIIFRLKHGRLWNWTVSSGSQTAGSRSWWGVSRPQECSSETLACYRKPKAGWHQGGGAIVEVCVCVCVFKRERESYFKLLVVVVYNSWQISWFPLDLHHAGAGKTQTELYDMCLSSCRQSSSAFLEWSLETQEMM